MQYKGYKGGVEPMEKIAVLIPCYNEEKTIKKVVRDWKKELPEATIYVYNNNSTDRTVKLQKRQELLCEMNISKEKEMLLEECFVRLMLSAML